MTNILRTLKLAFAFLTIVPLGSHDAEPSETDLAFSRYAYPVVGLAIGLVLAGLSELLGRFGSSPFVAAFVLLAASTGINGGLHLDGLADTCDGLFLTGDAERRLSVMRDSHLGSFGVTALVLVLLGKFAALCSLAVHARSLALVMAAAISRTLILVSAGSASYARPEGTGRVLVEADTPRDALAATAFALAVGLVLACGPGLFATLMALALAVGLTRVASVRLGGITGDILGALIELEELAILVILALIQSPLAK